MANQKKDPRSGELIFRTDANRRQAAGYRYFRHVEDQQVAAKKAAKKRAAAAKKGAEGPKQSKPGGYAMSYTPGSSTKKKRRA